MGTAQHTQRAYNLEMTSDCEVYATSLRRCVCLLGYVFWRIWSCTEQCNREALKSLNLYGLLTAFFFEILTGNFLRHRFLLFSVVVVGGSGHLSSSAVDHSNRVCIENAIYIKTHFCLRVIDSAPWKSYKKVDCLWENRDFHGLWKRILKIFFHAIAMTMHSKYFFHGQFNIHVFDSHSISVM